MRDPYEVLGVPKNASAEAIKAAFRRQAKKLHPDANKQDKKAAAKFAELNAAYEILGDENKRKAYDRGEIDAEGKPRFQGFEGFGAGAGPRAGQFADEAIFETFTFGPGGFQRSSGRGRGFGGIDEILRDVFGNMGGGGRRGFANEDFGAQPQGRDVTGSVVISLTEAAKGTTRRVRLPNGKEVEAKIPAGLADGQTIRLKGQGLPGPNGTIGDALITVTVAPHPLFKRDGADLRLDLPVTLYEALLGAKVRVPTLDGAVELAIPRGTNSGRTFRLRGKGLPSKSGGTGDLYATVRIMLPERSDPEFEDLMRRWRDTKPYDPRKDMG
ncbi:MAG TPA: J domain-containing protein [Xanthobacteraceae bacterium]|nr:J domain-containing protein [Xanthobacteraceae bacterium]